MTLSLVKWLQMPLLIIALSACGPNDAASSCDPVPVGPAVSDVERVIAEAGFDPIWPCSTRQGFTVSSVRVDSLGAEATNRLVVVVRVGDDSAYTLTASARRVAFTAIPRGAEAIAVEGDVGARGFRGRTAAGTEIAFLQWQHAGLTYEVTAMLGPRFDLDSLLSLIRGMTDARAVTASVAVSRDLR